MLTNSHDERAQCEQFSRPEVEPAIYTYMKFP
jgi:hypothetical protein